MRQVAIVVAAFAWLVPAATAGAHKVDADKPVIFFVSPQKGATDCDTVFGAMKSKVAATSVRVGGKDLRFKELVTLGPNPKASGCDAQLDKGANGTQALALRFATWAAARSPGPIDVVAEGDAGVAVRYALGMSGDGSWPKLDIEDVVTLGSPHAELSEPAFGHPEGTQGTDWTAIASKGDDSVKVESAIAIDADHRTVYQDGDLTHQKLLDDVSSERDAQIEYQHGDADWVKWNKAPHAAERVALDLVHGIDTCGVDAAGTGGGCSNVCKQDIGRWKVKFTCPERGQLGEGVKDITVTTPGGLEAELPNVPIIDYPLPLASARRLVEPLILPNLTLTLGNFHLAAYENTLGDDGLAIGTAAVTLPKIGEAVAYDLAVRPDGTVTADVLELEALGGQLEAAGVKFSAGGGLSAEWATVVLPAKLGGGAIEFSKLGVSADGKLSGRLSGGRVKIGDLTAEVSKATVTDTGFFVGEARLILPKYLGGADLRAKNLKWDGTTVTFSEASGKVDFALAGGKLRIASAVELKLLPGGGYEFSGSGLVVVPGEPRPFFEAAAELHVKSIDCKPAPGKCSNAAYLQKAALSLKTARPIPLGTTGLAIRGLSAEVKSTQEDPRRDADGTIRGVVYTFSLGADILTFPNEAVFDGKISGSLTTNANFGLSIDGTTLKFIRLHGGMCVLFTTKDTVCAGHLKRAVTGPGAFIRASASAGASYTGALGTLSAQLEASAFGSFVRSGGESYVDATVQGSFTATSRSWLLPDVEGKGTITAQLGRFKTPSGGAVLGVKGTIEAKLKAQSLGEGRELTQSRAIFISDGRYTEQNVADYTLAGPASAAQAGDRRPFRVREGQTGTSIVVEADEGSPSLELISPSGQRALIEAPGTIQALSGGPRDELEDVYAVETTVPHTVRAHIPKATPGRWLAQVHGAEPGRYRLELRSNRALPRVAVARRHATATRRHPVVTLTGTVRGGPRRASVSVHAGRGACARRGGAKLLAADVRVRRGKWRYRWNTRGTSRGRYAVHVTLATGPGPLVTGCGEHAVTIKRPKAKRRPKRARATISARRAPAPARAIAARHTDKQNSQCTKPVGPEPDRTPVFVVRESDKNQMYIAQHDYEVIDDNTKLSTLHYGLYSPKVGCRKISKKHRPQVCPRGKYKAGVDDGPPDLRKKRTSCDEYPYASTIEGGEGAETVGVEPVENNTQGGRYGSFLQENANALHHLKGKFHVCVVLRNGYKAGRCSGVKE